MKKQHNIRTTIVSLEEEEEEAKIWKHNNNVNQQQTGQNDKVKEKDKKFEITYEHEKDDLSSFLMSQILINYKSLLFFY